MGRKTGCRQVQLGRWRRIQALPPLLNSSGSGESLLYPMCSLVSSWTKALSAWVSLGTRTSPRAAVSSGAVLEGTEADFPWSAQTPYSAGSLNKSFLLAAAHHQAAAHSPLPAQGYPTQPLGRSPRLQSSQKAPGKRTLQAWHRERLGPGNPGLLAGLALIFWEAQSPGSVAVGHRQGPL